MSNGNSEEAHSEKSLEEKAKKLIRWRLKGEGEVPDTRDLPEQIEYMLNMKYIVKSRRDDDPNLYCLTPEGEIWAGV